MLSTWRPINQVNFSYKLGHSQYGENFGRSAALNADVAVSPSLILVCSGFPPTIAVGAGSEQVSATEVGGPWALIEAGSMNWAIPLRLPMLFKPSMPGGGSGLTTVMAMGWGDRGDKEPATDDTGGKEAGSRVKVLCNSMLRMKKKEEMGGNIRHTSKTFKQ